MRELEANEYWFNDVCDFYSSYIVRHISYCEEDEEVLSWHKVCKLFITFTKEVMRLFEDSNLTISHEDWESLCNKYIATSKQMSNWLSVSMFFDIYEEYPKDYIHYTDYFKEATEEEIEQARKDFSHVVETYNDEVREHNHTFSDDAKVLDYRGLRMIVDNEWSDAWIKDEKGNIRNFQLIWDWNYPIDQYIAYHIV